MRRTPRERERQSQAHRRRRKSVCLCVLCFLGALVSFQPAEAAIDDYLGKPIGSVRFLIEGRETTDPAIAGVVETRVGEAVTIIAVRESIAHLFSLRRFDDIRVDAELTGTGVALRYELSPIHPVSNIRFTGALRTPGVDTDAIRKAVVDRYGASPSLGHVEEMKELVADLLHERGYLHPEIQPRADIAHNPDRATLVFNVEPGPRAVVRTIDIVGAPTVSRGELLSRLNVSPGVPYQAEALRGRIERYIADRRKAGYYEAMLTATPAFSDGDRAVDLTISALPGPHVRVVFTGSPLPADKREELVPVEREGSVDEDLLEDSTRRIEDYLRGQGYRDAKAPHARQQMDGELIVTFDVARGREYRVERVDIGGNTSIAVADLEGALRLRAGEPFIDAKVETDLTAIEDLYRRRGFASAKARSSEEPQAVDSNAAAVPLRVSILISEGPRTVVSRVRVAGNVALSEEALKEGLLMQPGRPYLDAQLAQDRDAIQLRYANQGYATATVDADPNFSPDRTTAEPTFTVREGPRVFVDHVLIVGNVRSSTGTIQRELQFKSGDPLSEAAKIETRRRLAMLGLFRRVQIAELAHGDQTKRDILVTVEEAPATTVVFGGGFEGRVRPVRRPEDSVVSEQFELAPRGSFQISRRNLFGKNRSVSLFTSVTVRLQDSLVFDEGGEATTSGGFPEYRVLATYREPRLFNTAADAVITGTVEQQARSSFNFARRGASAEVARRVTPQLALSSSFQIQRTRVFDESVNPEDQRLIDRLFPQVRLVSLSSSAVFDTRDDAVDPGIGEYLSANFQLAGRKIGSEVGFAKTFLRAQWFRTLPQKKRLVVAGNASLGMATGFPREVVTTDALGVATTQTVEDLPASERFFAGGDTTVRGFSLDRLGMPAVFDKDGHQIGGTLDRDGLPLGGNATVIFNAELRATMWPSIQAVGFFDSGNVFAHATDIALGDVRSAVGFGVRYRSPVGPIRIDLGFKIGPQIVAGVREGLTALHISLGQAF